MPANILCMTILRLVVITEVGFVFLNLTVIGLWTGTGLAPECRPTWTCHIAVKYASSSSHFPPTATIFLSFFLHLLPGSSASSYVIASCLIQIIPKNSLDTAHEPNHGSVWSSTRLTLLVRPNFGPLVQKWWTKTAFTLQIVLWTRLKILHQTR